VCAFAWGWLGQGKLSSLVPHGPMAVPKIDKQPMAFASRTFDPSAPPADMPALNPGENAECDSDFVSYASVDGQPQQTDSTHATVTVTSVTVRLELNVTIWVPNNATQRVIDHEAGHRQISEHDYQNADKVAERIAAAYMGKQVEVTGADLGAASNKALEQMSSDITDEYNKELNPGPTQLRYDAITDHSRNDIAASDAVTQALQETTDAADEAAPTPSSSAPGN
jgi:hypothetical protein